jgi:hypothetical protein
VIGVRKRVNFVAEAPQLEFSFSLTFTIHRRRFAKCANIGSVPRSSSRGPRRRWAKSHHGEALQSQIKRFCTNGATTTRNNDLEDRFHLGL